MQGICFGLCSQRKWIFKPDSFDTGAPHTQDGHTHTQEVYVKCTTTWHPRSRIGHFASQDIVISEPEKYYFDAVLYCKTKVPWRRNVHENGSVSFTKHDFPSKAIYLGQMKNFFGGKTFNVWFIAFKVNFMHFINKPSLIPNGEGNTLDIAYDSRSFNMIFDKISTLQGDHLRCNAIKYLRRITSRESKSY